MLRATLKSLLGRKLRLGLTAISIVLGVGFVVGTYVLTDTMNAAFDELFTQASSASDVVVRAESAFAAEPGSGSGAIEEREPVPESLLATVRAVEWVEAATGDVAGYAQIVDPATGEAIGGFGPPTIGTNWNELSNAVLELRDGRAPEDNTEVVIDAATASSNDLMVGQEVEILFVGPPREFTVVGIAGFGEADNLAGATLALFDTQTAQQVLDKEGVYDSISAKAREGVSPAELRAEIETVLPEGTEAITTSDLADEQSEALQEGLGFFRIALLVFAFIALFVGAFIIFNTFSIIVAQRTRELGLLRVVGASRRQILVSVVVEAIAIGLLASIVGIVAGLAIAVGLKGLLAAFGIDLPSTAIQIEPRTIVAALVVGVGVTVLAAILPARRAARISPMQALQEMDRPEDRGSLGRRLTAGLVVAALGVAALLFGLFATPPNAPAIVGAGAAAIFLGIAIVSPLLARPVAGALGAPLRRLSVQGKLGRENAVRNPRRTAATASALMIGLGLVSMIAILAASLKASFEATLERTLRADLTVATGTFSPFSPDVATRVRSVPEVAVVSELRQGAFRVADATSFLSAVDPATFEEVATMGVAEGTIDSLSEGRVLVHTDLAQDKGWSVGDEIPSAFATVGDRPLEIGGIFDESGLLGDYVIGIGLFEELFQEQLDWVVFIRSAEGVDTDAAEEAVQAAVADFPNVEVQDQAAFREQQAGFIDQLLGLVTALLAMAIVIALFGIVNTLGLSVFERTRELGLLRAVGMSRPQVKRMIRWESVIIAVFGALLGLAIGILFGWALQQALQPEGVSELRIPGGQLVFYLVFAGLAGVVAAIWPARRAAKLDVLKSIAYE